MSGKNIYGGLNIFDHSYLKNQKSLRFADSDSSNYAAIQAPAVLGADYVLTLPVDDGLASQVMTTNGSGVLSWTSVLTATLSPANIFVGNGSSVATAVDTSAVGDISADSTTGLNIKTGVIVNADINAAAAVALSKLAALTTARSLVSDGSGIISVSATTATEIGYVSGVTSAIQAQLNNKADIFVATWATADGPTKTVTHSFGTRDVVVQLYDLNTYDTIDVDSVIRTDTNTVDLTATQAPTAPNGWRILVLKA